MTHMSLKIASKTSVVVSYNYQRLHYQVYRQSCIPHTNKACEGPLSWEKKRLI